MNLGRNMKDPEEIGLLVSVPAEQPTPKPSQISRAQTASKARRFLKNCMICGRYGCIVSKCPLRNDLEILSEEAARLSRKQALDPAEKRRRQLIARLKYTNVSQRTKDFDAGVRKFRAVTERSFTELACAPPGGLGKMLVQYGALANLQGLACVNPRCLELNGYGFENAHTLGQMCSICGVEERVVGTRSVWHRCVTSRMRYAINRGSKAFPPMTGGYGIRERSMCYWNMVHGASVFLTAKQTKLSEDTVQSYHRLGRLICATDDRVWVKEALDC